MFLTLRDVYTREVVTSYAVSLRHFLFSEWQSVDMPVLPESQSGLALITEKLASICSFGL